MNISILGCGWLGLRLGKDLVDGRYNVLGSTTHEDKIPLLHAAGIKPYVIRLPGPFPQEKKSFFDSDVLVITIPPNRKSGKTGEYIHQLHDLYQTLLSGSTRHVVFVSSTSVYNDTNNVVLEGNESSASYMVQAENIFRKEPFYTTVIRFGGLFGPDRHPGRFFAGKIDVTGGDAPVNMIHLDDAVGIIRAVIEQKVWNEVFNACAERHPTRFEFYTRMTMNAGLIPPVFVKNSIQPFKIVSSQKVRERLQYQFIVPDPLNWTEDK
jgi:nucleoside-diphosphate-sugar epimerase